MISRKKNIIEKLYIKHCKVFGQSPEYSFWSWLDACGIEPIEKDLQRVYKDKSYWNNEF